MAGEDITLECDIAPGKPAASIKWFKNDSEIFGGKKYTSSFMNETATLEIKKADFKDSGVYKCEASNKLGMVDTECTLKIDSKFFSLIVQSAYSFLFARSSQVGV